MPTPICTRSLTSPNNAGAIHSSSPMCAPSAVEFVTPRGARVTLSKDEKKNIQDDSNESRIVFCTDSFNSVYSNVGSTDVETKCSDPPPSADKSVLNSTEKCAAMSNISSASKVTPPESNLTSCNLNSRIGAPLPAPPKVGAGAVTTFLPPSPRSSVRDQQIESFGVETNPSPSPRQNLFVHTVQSTPQNLESVWTPSSNAMADMMSPDPPYSEASVELGVQQLERQQAEREVRQSLIESGTRTHQDTPMLQGSHSSNCSDTPCNINAILDQESPSYISVSTPKNIEAFSGGADTSPNGAGANYLMPNAAQPQDMDIITPNDPNVYAGIELNENENKSRNSNLIRFLAPLWRSESPVPAPKPQNDLETSGVSTHLEIREAHDGRAEDGNWRDDVKPLLYSYLYKRTRNGVWQRRFFETNAKSLTYYKTDKRSAVLATLDLIEVGAIAVDETDPTGCTFTIQLGVRPYYLRAENSAICKDWVINLNRIREARIQIGGIKLVIAPNFDFRYNETEIQRKQTESSEYAARIVMTANRERSHAIGDHDDCIKQMSRVIECHDTDTSTTHSQDMPSATKDPTSAAAPHIGRSPSTTNLRVLPTPQLLSHLSPELHADWQKSHPSLELVRNRFFWFITWMKQVGCIAKANENVSDGMRSVHPSDSSQHVRPFE